MRWLRAKRELIGERHDHKRWMDDKLGNQHFQINLVPYYRTAAGRALDAKVESIPDCFDLRTCAVWVRATDEGWECGGVGADMIRAHYAQETGPAWVPPLVLSPTWHRCLGPHSNDSDPEDLEPMLDPQHALYDPSALLPVDRVFARLAKYYFRGFEFVPPPCYKEEVEE